MKNFPIILLFFIVSSCAVTYKPISVTNYNFKNATDSLDKLQFFFSDTLVFSNNENKRFYKKTLKKKYFFLPIKIQNNSNDTFVFKSDSVLFYVNYEYVTPVNYKIYNRNLKQRTWLFGCEVLLSGIYFFPLYSGGFLPFQFNVQGCSFFTHGLYSFIKSYRANKKMENNLNELDLDGKSVPPHSSIQGVICLKTKYNNNILIRVK